MRHASSVAYRDSCPETSTTSVCCFAALLDMDDASHFYVLVGRFAGLILQNHWWLSQFAISPKPWFSLRFRRCGVFNNRMI
jgi:hypothetical protein